jgi:Ser/Thr protein kinase RdoA (MazF antagonist)
MLETILNHFGLNASACHIQFFGSGLINHTFKVTEGGNEYILQQINTDVFKSPELITNNLILLQEYLQNLYPDYLFVSPIKAVNGNFLIESDSDKYYRLFPFIKGSKTVDVISNEKQAFEAAKQFGKFTGLLKDFDPRQLKYTLTDFHNLTLRFDQFEAIKQNACPKRTEEASAEIEEVYKHSNIVETYRRIVNNNEIPTRVIHHDTKISNVLFDEQENGLCVIDLDTVMPGYFFSDVGDMMRTYLSPANEEETDFSKIHVRQNIFNAICEGYLAEMGSILTPMEKQYFVFSGKFMIYMQAIRFLSDYLNGDVYYGSKYPGHNLNRAKNQFKLLNEYISAEGQFKKLIEAINITNYEK